MKRFILIFLLLSGCINNQNANISEIVNDELFIKNIREVVARVNKNLSVIEQVKKFILINHEFTIENNMMTPSMKVRRFKVKEMYANKLDNLY